MGTSRMFDERELTNAVEIQARSYRLLRWVCDGVGRGFIPVTRAHEYTSEAGILCDDRDRSREPARGVG
jgi:hypothetical protein